jgi:hypothetical protein
MEIPADIRTELTRETIPCHLRALIPMFSNEATTAPARYPKPAPRKLDNTRARSTVEMKYTKTRIPAVSRVYLMTAFV